MYGRVHIIEGLSNESLFHHPEHSVLTVGETQIPHAVVNMPKTKDI